MRVQGRSIKFIDGELSKREEAQADLGDPQKAREPVRDDDWGLSNPYPASDSELLQWSPEQYRFWKESGKKPKDEVVGLSPTERFAAASDRMHGHRGALSQDRLAGLSPSEQFAARSAHKWASHDPRGRMADLRRRRSE